MKRTELVILVGNIASGKTEYIRRYLQRPENEGAVVLSKDALRWGLGGGNKYVWSDITEAHVHNGIMEMLQRFLAAGVSVIYDETNMDADTRKPFIDAAKEIFNGWAQHTFDIRAILMPSLSVGEAMRRRCGDAHEAWGFTEERWREVWRRKARLYQPPSHDEGFTTITSVGEF